MNGGNMLARQLARQLARNEVQKARGSDLSWRPMRSILADFVVIPEGTENAAPDSGSNRS